MSLANIVFFITFSNVFQKLNDRNDRKKTKSNHTPNDSEDLFGELAETQKDYSERDNHKRLDVSD